MADNNWNEWNDESRNSKNRASGSERANQDRNGRGQNQNYNQAPSYNSGNQNYERDSQRGTSWSSQNSSQSSPQPWSQSSDMNDTTRRNWRSYENDNSRETNFDRPRDFSPGHRDWERNSGTDQLDSSLGRRDYGQQYNQQYNQQTGHYGSGYNSSARNSSNRDMNVASTDAARYAGLGSSGSGIGFGSPSTSSDSAYSTYSTNQSSTQSGRDYTGRGPKGYRRSDERIREDVSDTLERHREIDASEIEVDVKEGLVTLRGAVEHRLQKRMAEDVIEHINGVKDVRNELVVNQILFDQAKELFTGEQAPKTTEAKPKTSRH